MSTKLERFTIWTYIQCAEQTHVTRTRQKEKKNPKRNKTDIDKRINVSMAAHPIQVLRHKCAFTHAQNKERNTKACVFRTSTCSFNLFLQNSKWASHSARTHLHTMHTQRSSLVIGRVRWLESRLSNVEEIREASGGHRVMSAKENIGRFYVVYKGMKSWWEKGCVVQLPPLPPLPLSYTHSHTNPPLFLQTWEYKIIFLNNKKWPLFHTSW